MIVIAVDLGHFKAYKVSKNPMESAKTELMESYDSVEAHGKLSEKYSDANGKFGMAGGKNGAATGNGEPHNTKIEAEKRMVKLIAKDINALIMKGDCAKWYLAAPKRINSQVIEGLEPDVKAKLGKNITADLTKTHRSAVLSHFE